MNAIIFFLTSIVLVYSYEDIDDVISKVNSKGNSWRAGVNARFYHAPEEYIQTQLGALIEENPTVEWPELEIGDIPDSYDPRDRFTECETVSEIRDQGSCGSCWAVAAVEAMSDRICIQTGKNIHLSAVDLLSCCSRCGYGCKGGYPIQAWRFWKKTGIVTGGQYNSSQGCKPYPIARCSHHVQGQYQECGSIVSTPECTTQCISSYDAYYWDDKHNGSNFYFLPRNETAIKAELYVRGPVEAAFKVYTDFLTYKEGVYQHTTGDYKGGHAVKMIGWGSEDGVDYWLAANSWNTDWGDKGYFKILRGDNECGIEKNMVAGNVYQLNR